jgi:hypothetical protein
VSYERYKELLQTFNNARLNKEIQANLANRNHSTTEKGKAAWQRMLDASLEVQRARDNAEMTPKP